MGEQDERLRVIGQIVVVRERLDILKKSLIKLPVGDMYISEQTEDALGNLSFQIGMLMGVVTKYKDGANAAPKTRKRNLGG